MEQWATALCKDLPCLNVQLLGLSNKLQVQAVCQKKFLVKSYQLHAICQVLSKSKNTPAKNFTKTYNFNQLHQLLCVQVLTSTLPWRSFKAKCQSPSSTTPHLRNMDVANTSTQLLTSMWKILRIPTHPTLIFHLPGYHNLLGWKLKGRFMPVHMAFYESCYIILSILKRG